MLSYSVRRLLGAIPTLFIVITVAFFMMRLAPGGPFDQDRVLPAQIEANIAAKYDLDKPLVVQYLIYVGNVLKLDFGPSIKVRDFTVTELIAGSFPVSLQLGGIAILAAVILGTILGSVAALKQNTGADYGIMGVAMTGITVPNFVMAPVLTLVFGIWLALLPVGGWGGGAVRNMVLPITALALPQIAYISRLTRGSMIEVLRSNFIRTARAKGLPEHLTLRRHAMRGAMLPVVSYLGPATANIITGSVVIEQIFGIPGTGRYFVQGALNRDYTLVMGTVIFFAVLIILLNLVVDLLYGVLDPKVRYD
jgi:oligopeptide transport system permease protein